MSNAPAKAALPGTTSAPSAAAPGADEKIQFGLYRYGQGYWVRVMTAALAGIVLLSAALWAYKMLSAFDVPTPTWSVRVENAVGTPAPGSSLTLIDDRSDAPKEIGSALVKSYEQIGKGGSIIIDKVSMKGDALVSEATKVSGAGVSAVVAAPPQGIPIFDKRFLQLGVATAILLVGVYFIYSFVGRRERSVEFLVAVDGEMKKVNWSTRKNVIDSTIVVVVATFLIAFVLALYDVGIGKVFSTLFRLIGIYQ